MPAEVAFHRLDLLALHGAGQGVRTARTEELATSAHLQLSLDRAGIHRDLLHIAGAVSYCDRLSCTLWLGASHCVLYHPRLIASDPASIVSICIGCSRMPLHVRKSDTDCRWVCLSARCSAKELTASHVLEIGPTQGIRMGGSVKAEGLGDGCTASQEGHRQAALDAATRPARNLRIHDGLNETAPRRMIQLGAAACSRQRKVGPRDHYSICHSRMPAEKSG